MIVTVCTSCRETEEYGRALFSTLSAGDVVALSGPLGAGKTTLVRGLLRASGWTGRVPSPSFTLVNEYPTTPPVFHSDLYRLGSIEEVEDLDLLETARGGILLVEWADRAAELFAGTARSIRIEFDPAAAETRTVYDSQVSIHPGGGSGGHA